MCPFAFTLTSSKARVGKFSDLLLKLPFCIVIKTLLNSVGHATANLLLLLGLEIWYFFLSIMQRLCELFLNWLLFTLKKSHYILEFLMY